jgi:membrane fusion protein, multidrug efflux system
MAQEENRETGPHGKDLGHSFRAHTGDTGAAFEEHNETIVVVKKSHTWLWIALILIVLVAAFLVYHFTGSGSTASSGAAKGRGQNGPAAITVGQSTTGSINIYVDALGTVTPTATVTLYSQITGRVMAVYYHEGQLVRKGQALVDIDPRPYEANLTQAEGNLKHDQGVLAQARMDLARYQAAYARNAIAKQILDDQEQAVVQDEGSVQSDQGTVDYDKVQLAYCHIVAPITGRVGLRLVDPGNTVFSGSSSTLVVITQLQPMTVVFSPSEDSIPQIQTALKGNKALEVDAFDRADEKMLEAGKPTAYDNQIDTTTGTVKFRANFANKDLSLFPNQFVNARLLVQTLNNATLIPTVAVQHNGTAAFVYLVNTAASTVAVQSIDVVTNNDTVTAATGINPGVNIATSGFDRLENGAKVAIAQPGQKGKSGSTSGTGGPGSSGSSGSSSGGSKSGGSTAP